MGSILTVTCFHNDDKYKLLEKRTKMPHKQKQTTTQ